MELNAPAIINSCVGIMLLKNLTLIRDTEINLTLTRAAANTAKRVVSSWVRLRVCGERFDRRVRTGQARQPQDRDKSFAQGGC